MDRGVLNPWAFIALYVTLWWFSSSSEGSFFAIASVSLHLWWTWSSVRFLSVYALPSNVAVRRYLRRMNFLLVSIALGTAFTQFWFANRVGSISGFEFAAFAVIVLLIFAVFWTASQALCVAELGGDKMLRIVGTFLCYVYLIFGAPFLYRRLMRVDSEGNSASTRSMELR